MVKAKLGRRLLALLIDLTLVIVVTTLLASLSNMIFKLNAPEDVELKGVTETQREIIIDKLETNSNLELVSREKLDRDLSTYVISFTKDEWLQYLDEEEQPSSFVLIFNNYYDNCVVYNKAYTKYLANFMLITFASFLIVFIIYYDVVGYYWHKQTLGRLLCKIKVVKTDGSAPSFYTLFVRDVVGFALFNVLNICMLVPVIINTLNITGKDQTSLADNMTKTMVVRVNE